MKLIDQKLFQGRMSTELRTQLINSVQSTSDPTNRVLGALYLAALSSEYLVHAQ